MDELDELDEIKNANDEQWRAALREIAPDWDDEMIEGFRQTYRECYMENFSKKFGVPMSVLKRGIK